MSDLDLDRISKLLGSTYRTIKRPAFGATTPNPPEPHMNERDAVQDGPKQDGPNTHHFRSYRDASHYTVVGYLDLVGTMHLFHVPREVADTLTKPLHTEIERLREALTAIESEQMMDLELLAIEHQRIAREALAPQPASEKEPQPTNS